MKHVCIPWCSHTRALALNQTIAIKSGDINSLQDREEHYERILRSEEESIKKMIEERLIALKPETPELFYIANAEQVAKLAAIILRRLLS